MIIINNYKLAVGEINLNVHRLDVLLRSTGHSCISWRFLFYHIIIVKLMNKCVLVEKPKLFFNLVFIFSQSSL